MSRNFKYKQMYFKIISFYFLLCFAREQKNSFKAVFSLHFRQDFTGRPDVTDVLPGFFVYRNILPVLLKQVLPHSRLI